MYDSKTGTPLGGIKMWMTTLHFQQQKIDSLSELNVRQTEYNVSAKVNRAFNNQVTELLTSYTEII